MQRKMPKQGCRPIERAGLRDVQFGIDTHVSKTGGMAAC
jgi:hypothetical protein